MRKTKNCATCLSSLAISRCRTIQNASNKTEANARVLRYFFKACQHATYKHHLEKWFVKEISPKKQWVTALSLFLGKPCHLAAIFSLMVRQ